MKKLIILFISTTILIGVASFKIVKNPEEKIQWYTFQQAVELNKKNPKKIFVDVYTSWCGWCKVMDAQTFTNPVIIKNLNKYYYAVKLNAEMKDTVIFNEHKFVNPNPTARGSSHELATALLNNQMSYPTTVYLDEGFNMLTPVPGFLKPENMEPILLFYGEDHYKTKKWEDYFKDFKGEVVAK